MLRSGIAGLLGKYIVLKKLPGCCPKRLYHCVFPSQVFQFASSLRIIPSTVLGVLSVFRILAFLGVWWYVMVLTWISKMMDNVKHLFMGSLATCISLVECLFKSFAHWKVGLSVFCVKQVFNFFFFIFGILDVNALLVHDLPVSVPVCGLCFHFLNVAFWRVKVNFDEIYSFLKLIMFWCYKITCFPNVRLGRFSYFLLEVLVLTFRSAFHFELLFCL